MSVLCTVRLERSRIDLPAASLGRTSEMVGGSDQGLGLGSGVKARLRVGVRVRILGPAQGAG